MGRLSEWMGVLVFLSCCFVFHEVNFHGVRLLVAGAGRWGDYFLGTRGLTNYTATVAQIGILASLRSAQLSSIALSTEQQRLLDYYCKCSNTTPGLSD